MKKAIQPGTIVITLAAVLLLAPCALAEWPYNPPIVVPIPVVAGDKWNGTYTLRGHEITLTSATMVDMDSVLDPMEEEDNIADEPSWRSRYRNSASDEWSSWSIPYDEEDCDFSGSGSVLSVTLSGDGLYQFKVTADDEALYQEDDPVSATSPTVKVRGVDYVLVTPNPAYVAFDQAVEFTAKAMNDGDDNLRQFDEFGKQIPGNATDDHWMTEFTEFDWALGFEPDYGTLDPTSGPGSASTTYTAGIVGGTDYLSATCDDEGPNEMDGTATVTVMAVDYVNVVTNPSYVGISGTVGFTAIAYNYGADNERQFDVYNVQIEGQDEDDIVLTATFTWTLTADPNLGTLNPTSESATTTMTAGTTPGADTVRATYDDGGENEVSGTAAVYVIQVVQNYDLWWFEGEYQSGYCTEAILTALGATTGTFEWEVTVGADKVDLYDDGEWGDEAEDEDVNTVAMMSTAASAPAAQPTTDVKVTFKVNDTWVYDFMLSVYAPHHFVYLSQTDVADEDYGYYTKIHYRIEDQYNNVLPYNVHINEKWTGAVVPDHEGMDWRRGPHGGSSVSPADWWDDIKGEESTRTPTPLAPMKPWSGAPVYHWPGEWRVGSLTVGDGVLVGCSTANHWAGSPTCVWQKYRGFACHE